MMDETALVVEPQVPISQPFSFQDSAVAYRTKRGTMFHGYAEHLVKSPSFASLRRKVSLIFTSPPFPLNRKKKYGNLHGEAYIKWLASFAKPLRELLRPNGSIVIELGNAWESGRPIMSTLALEALLAFVREGEFNVCQQFVCYNPARLPSPAQWVNVERIRVKDSYTHVWWLSPAERPQADNRQVLKDYSPAMERLLRKQKYNAGKRPSEHSIGKTSFLTRNQGAIPSNVLTMANTSSADSYLEHCRALGLKSHPARMPRALPEFFIRLLTKKKNLVLDPFGGSNTTGAVAEDLKRRWIAIEPDSEYIRGSAGRFSEVRWENEG